MNLSRCKRCGADMRWIVTPNGKNMPLDPQPGSLGNVVIDTLDEKGVEHGHVLKADEDPECLRFVAHFATCTARRR